MRGFHTLSCVLTSSVTLLDVLDQSGSVRRVETQAKTCLNVGGPTKRMGHGSGSASCTDMSLRG